MQFVYKPEIMERALALARQSLDDAGTEPFAAIVVRDGKIVGEGINRSLAKFDPTSHGEIEAIRDACFNLKSLTLSDCEIYTTCEACALCVAAIKIAGIRAMYYAAALTPANEILDVLPNDIRHCVEVAELRNEAGSQIFERTIPVQQVMSDEAMEILRSWTHRKLTQL